MQTRAQTTQPAYASRGRKSLQHDPICTIPERPCRPTRASSPLASQTLAPRSSHGRPTVIHRHGRCVEKAPRHSPRRQQRMPARRPSAHSTCIRLGIPTPVQHKALLGYLQATSQGTDCGRLLLMLLLRTPTEPTLSYHILCPSRAITHTPGGHTTARHTFPRPLLLHLAIAAD